MRLAHFSDLHITHFPLRGRWAWKRLAAVASYCSGRGRHFHGSDARIAALLQDVDEQGAAHGLCTGDLTGVATEGEFARIAALFGDRLHQPERFTVLPGNHDRYVDNAAENFGKHFSLLCEYERFPFIKHISPQVTLIGVNSAHPRGIVDSSGEVGEAQRQRLRTLLRHDSLRSRFVIVALHYGLLRKDGSRDKKSHGLRDDQEMINLLDDPELHVDLILHGHMHHAYHITTARRLVINAGSATDLHSPGCGYNILDIDEDKRELSVHRRVWHASEARYVAGEITQLNCRVAAPTENAVLRI